MVEHLARVPPSVLDALAELEREVVAADGGRLKLERDVLRDRPVPALVQRDGGRLVGFLGLYSFGGTVELAGAVVPDARGRGTGTALVRAALAVLDDDPLLVVPRPSAAGARLAARLGGVLHHSEHALVLSSAPAAGPADPGLVVRPAGPSDAPAVRRLLEAEYGPSAGRLHDGTLVVERAGAVVATLRVTRDGAAAGVYGVVVEAGLRGRGLGRDVLRRVCADLVRGGVERVGLEVEVDNDRALHLYTSLGFRPVVTEDYWRLPAR